MYALLTIYINKKKNHKTCKIQNPKYFLVDIDQIEYSEENKKDNIF